MMAEEIMATLGSWGGNGTAVNDNRPKKLNVKIAVRKIKSQPDFHQRILQNLGKGRTSSFGKEAEANAEGTDRLKACLRDNQRLKSAPSFCTKQSLFLPTLQRAKVKVLWRGTPQTIIR